MKSKMILPVLLLFLSATVTQSLFEGESCTFTNGDPGVCVLLKNCQSVKEQLIIGNVPNKVCGYSGFEVITCCPPTPNSQGNLMGDANYGRGAIARQKCVEYSQSVYVLRQQPTLINNGALVNVSQCTIHTQKLIVSGPRAEPGEFPHMAAVGFDLKTGEIGWHCSGTLISETFVLTAAHCTHTWQLGNATWVRVGDIDLMDAVEDGAKPEDRRIIQRIRHPQYKLPSQYHDIALLRLESRVPFNRWIRPACLYTSPSLGFPKAIVTGWGQVSSTEDASSSTLMKIILPIVDSRTCNTSWASVERNSKLPYGVVDDWIICARTKESQTCQGDSGGPLTIYSKENYCMYDVVGITSLGKSCSSNELPGIYTRVYNYISWIESIVWG